ncbi:TetR family transcriptional regulator [Nocardia brasiliensis]|uniref:TetR family transcriptional regulator n=2 Tax=Nocardia brasiliensis TaxID=37326 RepID=A0A6G9Y1T9_NOCBR|nr:TetR family transcriptional regulator [Nocardia brasiliensis]
MPAELSRLWRLAPSARLGRPAELDVDQVVRKAVELADRDGLAGVTLMKVAAALGFTKMALYRHVGSKDELFELMADYASGPAPEFPIAPADWRTALRRWANEMRATHLRHPWLPQVPVAGPPRGPNTISWMDAHLRILAGTPLDWATKVAVMMLVSGHVRQASLLTQQLAEGRVGTGLDEAQVNQAYTRSLAELVDRDRYPEAAKLFGSTVFDPPPAPPADPTEDPDFACTLEIVLNGIAHEIAAAEKA